ncbi:hypothetical protein KC573_00730 [candidate division WWE3 bacterium]|uniref:Uncharacterized protein n=1 Tax=candidate division WWE3 bacterium TaxID=2053526 RepID=A0A955LV69_UNCKA|nr:hypothetical protein [candidate division WWE3 bacterium]
MSETIGPNGLDKNSFIRPKPELDVSLPYLGEQGDQLTTAVIESIATDLTIARGGESVDYLEEATGMVENMEPKILRIHQRFFHWQQELQEVRQKIMSMLTQAGETRFRLEELEASLFKTYDIYDVDSDDIPIEDVAQIRSFVEKYQQQVDVPVSVDSLCDYLQKKVLFEKANKQREIVSRMSVLSEDFVAD